MKAILAAALRNDRTISVLTIIVACALGAITVAAVITLPTGRGLGYLLIGAGAGLAVTALTLVTLARSDDEFAPTATPEAWTGPLQVASPAEKNLTTDLRQRRMLLRPRGLSETKAAKLAGKVTRRTLIGRAWQARAAQPVPPAQPPAPAGDAATTGWARLGEWGKTRPQSPRKAAKGGRHAAPRGHVPASRLLHGEPEPETTVPGQLPEGGQGDGEPGPLFPDWPTGAFAAVMEAGETA